jgi:hypothetical protein
MPQRQRAELRLPKTVTFATYTQSGTLMQLARNNVRHRPIDPAGQIVTLCDWNCH